MDGETLVLQFVSRSHMGAYLCIASNGVPPSVSKRITLEVECKSHLVFILILFDFIFLERKKSK